MRLEKLVVLLAHFKKVFTEKLYGCIGGNPRNQCGEKQHFS